MTDSLIMAAQTMLAAQYPEIRGLQDTIKGTYLTFSSVPKNCVQIFYVGELVSCTLVISMCFRVPSMRGLLGLCCVEIHFWDHILDFLGGYMHVLQPVVAPMHANLFQELSLQTRPIGIFREL